MQFGQLIESNVRISFIQKSCRKRGRGLVPDLFLFFKRALYEVRISGHHLSFNTFW